MAGSIRPRLASAVAKLKEAGAYDEAAAVEAVTGPRGYLLLRRTETGSTDVLSITVPEMLKKAVNETAEAWDLVLDALAEEAYRRVRDDGWVPPETARAGRGKPGSRAVLQVNVDSQLRAQVQEMLPALKEQAGYRVTEGSIVLTHICEELGIERPNADAREQLETRLPKSLVRHWNERAEAEGVSLEELVEERIPALVDGSWTPQLVDMSSWSRVRAGSLWSESDRAKLYLRLDKVLLADLRSEAEALSEESGSLVHPGALVRAILTDRLGEPAE